MFPTTAILCGNEQAVDEDNNQALVWVILGNSDSTSKDEIEVTFSGKDAVIKSASRKNGLLTINTSKPTNTVVINESDIDPANCESGNHFSVTVESANTLESIGECRCFQD